MVRTEADSDDVMMMLFKTRCAISILRKIPKYQKILFSREDKIFWYFCSANKV